jgi:hypothetical protein
VCHLPAVTCFSRQGAAAQTRNGDWLAFERTDAFGAHRLCIDGKILVVIAGYACARLAAKKPSAIGGKHQEIISVFNKAYFAEAANSEDAYLAPGWRGSCAQQAELHAEACEHAGQHSPLVHSLR